MALVGAFFSSAIAALSTVFWGTGLLPLSSALLVSKKSLSTFLDCHDLNGFSKIGKNLSPLLMACFWALAASPAVRSSAELRRTAKSKREDVYKIERQLE